MANYIDCSTKAFAKNSLVRALFNTVDADGTYGIRVASKTKLEGGVITCATKDNFMQLFLQALELGDDGIVTLRICVTDFADGAGLSSADDCDTYKSFDLLSRLAFVETTDNEVALSLLNIT